MIKKKTASWLGKLLHHIVTLLFYYNNSHNNSQRKEIIGPEIHVSHLIIFYLNICFFLLLLSVNALMYIGLLFKAVQLLSTVLVSLNKTAKIGYSVKCFSKQAPVFHRLLKQL